eukprot:CAMPEP_0204589906 /NCGR_PEP_ID=MMETSP0661-20131031/49476_1 /ASSEMBLY_ACC=CAM_ASM_000606 /TAXON_ID=109239 /ORGANISM="Alexandrium margalefi, Strain AMGDE01CS-322" /LENGTH=59 /DNA_ID=CAMNT_0051599875 /DNA_START=68 /DNA_END=242 /DNA_ORIENTATION=-
MAARLVGQERSAALCALWRALETAAALAPGEGPVSRRWPAARRHALASLAPPCFTLLCL